MKSKLKRTVVFTTGAAFIPLGIAGLVLPFLQGFLFLAIGIILLSIASPTVREWSERHTRRFPRFHDFVVRFEARVARIIGE